MTQLKTHAQKSAAQGRPLPGGSSSGAMSAAGPIVGMAIAVVVCAGIVMFASNRPAPWDSKLPPIEREVIVVADISKSTDKTRRAAIASIDETSLSVGENDALTIIKFASSATEIYSGRVSNPDAVRQIIQELRESDPRPGSDYIAAYKLIDQAVKRSTAKEVIILIVGDGVRNGLEQSPVPDTDLYRSAAQAFAKDAKVRQVRFYGISADLNLRAREDIRAAFFGLDATRLRILNPKESAWPESD